MPSQGLPSRSSAMALGAAMVFWALLVVFSGVGPAAAADVAIPQPDGGHTDAELRTAAPRTSLLLRYAIDDRDKDLVRAPESIAAVAAAGPDALYIAQRNDFLAQDLSRTAIIDVSDLAFP